MAKVERPKEPKKVLNGFTDDGVIAMMNAFTTENFLELWLSLNLFSLDCLNKTI